jgi:hypothetical protein
LRRSTVTERRDIAASVSKRNGAYLVSHDWGNDTRDLPANELYEAAGSFPVAKRIAVEGARSLGYSGAVRWQEVTKGLWYLEMIVPSEDPTDKDYS